MAPREVKQIEYPDYVISTDPARLDLDVVHRSLAKAYWSEGIPRQTLERAIQNSLCFGVYVQGRQAAFARVITDRATYAYLCDVFTVEGQRGGGLGKRLLEAVMSHPDLQGLRRWSLLTRDAHGLYRRFGFVPPEMPERYMEITHPDIHSPIPSAEERSC
jgi:N-acetylglutamate synthase-like GNAT family acetyltransferase